MAGKKNQERRAEVRELIRRLTQAEVANRLGISPQRVHQILKDEGIDYRACVWLPVVDCRDRDILQLASADKPRLGHHASLVYTLPDGRWLVFQFSNPGAQPQNYIVLPKPP